MKRRVIVASIPFLLNTIAAMSAFTGGSLKVSEAFHADLTKSLLRAGFGGGDARTVESSRSSTGQRIAGL
jgi:hypothetical protein